MGLKRLESRFHGLQRGKLCAKEGIPVPLNLLSIKQVFTKRTRLALVTLCLLVALLCPLSSVRAAISDQSVGYWKFDEASGLTAADSSPTGNHGTLQGSTTWVAGKINSALSFDGLTGYVEGGHRLESVARRHRFALRLDQDHPDRQS